MTHVKSNGLRLENPDAPYLRELDDPLSTEPRNDLREAIMDEAYKCTTNVQMVERGLNIRNLMTETLLVDTVDSVPLAVKPDAIKYAEELFVTEIKATHILKPEHIVQTEVYRRAVEERLAKPPHALILRVDVDNCEVVHLAPDSQLCSTARGYFDKGLVPQRAEMRASITKTSSESSATSSTENADDFEPLSTPISRFCRFNREIW